MAIEILVPVVVVGLAASILTELLKLFPVLSMTDERKRIVAFMVALVLSLLYIPTLGATTDAFTFIIGVLSATFILFKAIVQPIEGTVVSVYKIIRKP